MAIMRWCRFMHRDNGVFEEVNKFSQNSLNKLKGVHPDLVKVAHEALKRSTIDFGISQGVRTKEEQNALYEQGRTKPGPIVTWTRNSKHIPQKDGYGHAIDFVCYVNGKVTWEEKYYPVVVKAMLNAAQDLGIKIIAGANWKTPDLPHIELDGSYYADKS
jgi:peptidoglycan L-alanyl-D-glutamate endopeptidase CwlK